MIIKRVDTSHFLIGCNDRGKLDLMKAVMDGAKVRMKNQIIVPITSLSKLSMFTEGSEVDYGDDSAEVVKYIKNNTAIRVANVAKIKDAYKGDVPFDYEYYGVYGEIMKHQKVMYNMLVYTNACAILSDPGTGKTGPLLWAIDQKMKEGKVKKCLFITLSGLKDNVMAEVLTELPHRSGVVLDGKTKSDKILNKKFKSDKQNKDYDIYIANYESMYSLVELFDDYYFDMVILDEAHRAGSPKSRQTKAIVSKFEAAKYKYISTGTLNANNLMSFYMPYRFLGADVVPYANYYTFRQQYMTAVDPDQHIWVPKQGAKGAVAKIVGKVAVLFKKEDCMDLPGVVYEKLHCDLEGEQKKAYKQAKKDMVIQIEELCKACEHADVCDRSACSNEDAYIQNSLVLARKLHQMASGFFINSWVEVDEETGREERKQNVIDFGVSSKIKLLIETLRNIPEDRKVIIWASYTHSVEMIMTKLRNVFGDDKVISAYGQQDGFEQMKKFAEPGMRFMVANTVKMGTGYNAQFSSYMVFFDNTFSYVTREQAVGRQYRKGQGCKVTVLDLITRETIDEHIMDTLYEKEDLSITLSQMAKILQ